MGHRSSRGNGDALRWRHARPEGPRSDPRTVTCIRAPYQVSGQPFGRPSGRPGAPHRRRSVQRHFRMAEDGKRKMAGSPDLSPGSQPSLVWSRRCPALPRLVGRSTIGAGGLSFRVRDGSGRVLPAVAAEGSVVGCVWLLWWLLLLWCGCCGVVVVVVLWWLVGCGGWVGCGPYSGRGVFPWCLVPSLVFVGLGPWVWGGCGCVCVGLLVPVGCARCRVFTSGLSTQWCSGGLPGGVLLWRPGLEGGFPLRCFQRLSLSERGQPVVPLAGQLAH